MKDQRSYFEKADFHSNLPLQFLTVAIGLMLVVIELGLAQWPVFYGAAPNLSLIFIYYMVIYHNRLLPIFSRFRVGIIGDFLLSDLLGGRATALMLLATVMQVRLFRLQQSDFAQLWIDFGVSCGLVSIFQLIFFSLLNMTIPSLDPILFQFGANLILFPLGFVIIFAVHQLMQKMKIVG
jgi:rod shape-determining protein MreD